MGKRLTADDKWSRPWFRRLSPVYKCLWLYILDNCDCAGVWTVDFEMAGFKIGARISSEKALHYLGKQITFLDEGAKWLIKDFVVFQHGPQLSHKNPFHAKVLATLKNHSLSTTIFHGLPGPSSARPDGLNKNTNRTTKKPSFKGGEDLFGEEEKRRPPFVKPTLAEVRAYCMERNNNVDPMRWMSHYESNGWRVGRNPMKNWKAAVVNWEGNDFKSGSAKQEISGPVIG